MVYEFSKKDQTTELSSLLLILFKYEKTQCNMNSDSIPTLIRKHTI